MHRLLIFLILPAVAGACECFIAPFCELIRTSPVVFWGETVQGGLDPDEDAWSGVANTAKLRVIEAFRGIDPNQREVEVAVFSIAGMCSPMSYRRGARTLVFLGEPTQGQLRDSMCSASRFVEEGSRELVLARRYFARAPTTVIGTVRQNDAPYMARMQPLEGATIHVVRNGSTGEQTVKTSPDGSFEIVGLPPGQYRLWVSKDGYQRRDDGSATIELSKSGCALEDLSLWAPNSVSGQVIAWNGAPVEGARVFLRRRDAPPIKGWGLLERTNYDGRFRFKEVSPGEYEAVVSPFGPRPESPYQTAFHGGAARREDAKPFLVGPESQIEGIQIVLGSEFPTRLVRVAATTPDGAEAQIKISCREWEDPAPPIPWFRSIYFDQSKPNECRVLTDRPFEIVVQEVERPGGGGRTYWTKLTSQRTLRVEPGANDVELRLEILESDLQ